jgi:hypothetical protein
MSQHSQQSQPPVAPAPTELCRATYDEPQRADRSDTHTCDLEVDHDGPHYCATCSSYWTARVGVVPDPNPAREQIALSRMDAHLLGTGWVMITRDQDGTYYYERVDPVRVTLETPDAAEVDPDLETAIRRVARRSIANLRIREKLDLQVLRAKRRTDDKQGWIPAKAVQQILEGDIPGDKDKPVNR